MYKIIVYIIPSGKRLHFLGSMTLHTRARYLLHIMVVLSNMSATNQNAATAATTSVDFVDLSKVQNVPSTSVHSGDLSKKVVKCTYQTTVSKWLGKKH